MSTRRVGSGVVSIASGGHRERVLGRRDELVASHLSLVEGIARGVARGLPGCFDLEDLIGVGNVALVRAATRYRPGDHGGAPFSAYARLGIRGAMLDSVRQTWCDGTGGHGYRPLAVSLSDLTETEYSAGRDAEIERLLDATSQASRLAEAISWLPVSQQDVLLTYYGADQPTVREISARLAFSLSKTRRLHGAAIEGLRARFKLRAA
jgi:RNA polymerase sigma factor (sigma-70 family)